MPEKPKPTRKRNRKRKRVVSDSSSSEDSSDTSTPEKTVTIPVRQPKTSENADTDESSSSESSDESEESDPGEEDVDISVPSRHPAPLLQRDSPSPQPKVDIPPLVTPNAPESEKALKEKFRKFWMASIAEGFKDDLEEIRKEPNLGPSRLALLIESLASGADVFSSSSAAGCVNEMEVVLDQLP
ncbi:hypothetical protein OG21DRAFT_1514220 [Imleria badia]|nr:hypothetical protein OG21DRAFT_1514220 [Imleria badia]